MDNFWSGTGKPGLKFTPGYVEFLRRAEVVALGLTTEWTQPAVWLVTCFQLQRYYELLLVSRVLHLCTQITAISVIIIYVRTVQSNTRKPCYRRENRAMPYRSSQRHRAVFTAIARLSCQTGKIMVLNMSIHCFRTHRITTKPCRGITALCV